jgi:hypothetical protein
MEASRFKTSTSSANLVHILKACETIHNSSVDPRSGRCDAWGVKTSALVWMVKKFVHKSFVKLLPQLQGPITYRPLVFVTLGEVTKLSYRRTDFESISCDISVTSSVQLQTRLQPSSGCLQSRWTSPHNSFPTLTLQIPLPSLRRAFTVASEMPVSSATSFAVLSPSLSTA